jgi:hypothetical protein
MTKRHQQPKTQHNLVTTAAVIGSGLFVVGVFTSLVLGLSGPSCRPELLTCTDTDGLGTCEVVEVWP